MRQTMKRWRQALREKTASVGRWAALRLGRGGDEAQGTTEYAILVGVLVVIAIVAIIALRPQIQALWQSIVDGVGQLSS